MPYKDVLEAAEEAEESGPQYIDPSSFTLPEALAGKLELHEGKFDKNEAKVLVYGESGVGKTVFSSTWPEVVFLNIDKGLASVKKKVYSFEIESWPDLITAAEYLEQGNHPFKTIVLDSMNELQNISMVNVVGTYRDVRRSYNTLPGIGDYGKMLDDVDKMIRYLRSLPYNVIFIAQVAERKFDTDQVQPQLVGKASARNICRMMDVVAYLDKKDSSEGNKIRYMVFDAVNYVTKDRSGLLPQQMDNPTYDALARYWNE